MARFAGGGEPWPPYTLERRETLVLDRESRVEADPLGDVRDVWEGLVVHGSMQAPVLA